MNNTICWVSFLDTNLPLDRSGCVGCAQRTDDMKIVFKSARGAPYKLRPNEKVLKKKKDALTRSFSPDYSDILLTPMAMRSVFGSGRSNVGTLPDTIDCTPAARQIQAEGGMGY